MSQRTGTILDQIVDRTSADLAGRRGSVPLDDLERRIAELPPAVPFGEILRAGNPGLIAEFKRASPSKGVIADGLEPADVASDYIAGGASAISVLTDGPFFQGTLEDIERVAQVAHRAEPRCAVLRKDFTVDEYQIAEARAHGADVVLLIVAVLKGAVLRGMLDSAAKYGVEALVEVHDEAELDEALAAGAKVIGINNRDLKTFEVDLGTTERLAPEIPADRTIVAESGIFTREDVERLQAAGAHAILVGESLMKAANRQSAVRALLGRP
jgi:indole-3-glycerol phosphate synthase